LFGLMDESERWPVPAKVCWISTAGNNTQPGIGVQFIGDNAEALRREIDETLGGLLNSERETATM